MHVEDGQSTELYASQLVQLLQQSSDSSESLARLPIVEYLKQQAEGKSSSADPHITVIWQLTGTVVYIMSFMARLCSSSSLRLLSSLLAVCMLLIVKGTALLPPHLLNTK